MPTGMLRAFFLSIVFGPTLLLAQDKATEPPLVRVTVDLIQLEAVVSGSLRLGNQLPEGEYTLRIIAIDQNRSANRGTVTQSVDLNVRP